jgi:hypothetical protein
MTHAVFGGIMAGAMRGFVYRHRLWLFTAVLLFVAATLGLYVVSREATGE